jgi:hypothetical protein
MVVVVKSSHNTPTTSEDDEKFPTTKDEKTNTGVTTTERSILASRVRFGEMYIWILYWNNLTLSKDPKQEQT